jgi:hypothetical protein
VGLGALVRKPRQTGLKKSANRCGSELGAFAGKKGNFPDPPYGRKHWLNVCRRENEQRTKELVCLREQPFDSRQNAAETFGFAVLAQCRRHGFADVC